MERYTFLETCAFTVIAILGIKLTLTLFTHTYPCSAFSRFMEGEGACNAKNGAPMEVTGQHELVAGDILTTVLTLAIFFLPILSSLLFNFPKRGTPTVEHETE
jgi:predicted secreted protein